MDKLIDLVLLNDINLRNLFCKQEILTQNIKYYSDNQLSDMYDHNFYYVNNIDLDSLNYIENRSKDTNFIKIVTDKDNLLLDKYEHGEIIVMCKENYNEFSFVENNKLTFKNLKCDDILNDILDIELRHYGKQYGESFTKRKLYRYYDVIKNNSDLNMFGAYIDNKLVGYCYAYMNSGVVAIDDLLVDEQYRNQRIASTLIKYICNLYKVPMYLHADNDDTPKYLYEKLGFVVLDQKHEYFRIKNEI